MSGNILRKKGLVPAAAIGLGGAVLLTALLCLLFAGIIHRETLPLSAAEYCAAAAAGIAVFAATLIVSRLRGRQAMPTAAIIAGGLVFLAALICALGGAGSEFGPWLIHLCIAAFCGGLLGAIMSIGHNPHKKSRSPRR